MINCRRIPSRRESKPNQDFFSRNRELWPPVRVEPTTLHHSPCGTSPKGSVPGPERDPRVQPWPGGPGRTQPAGVSMSENKMSRRHFLKHVAGYSMLALPGLQFLRTITANAQQLRRNNKSLIIMWMGG